MADDPRLDQILEELLESSGTPEEACRSCPELLPQVREGLRRLRLLDAEVGVLFPSSTTPNCTVQSDPPPTDLPHVPGYELEALLGRGGVGVVYKARHLRLNRSVALKMLLSGPYAGPQELERFLREAEAVAGLRHANIVQVYDVGDVDSRPYFTMELVEGSSLAQKIAGAPQPAREAAALVAALADAVRAAHQSGIVHRDLKPSNVLIGEDGTPKVTDFGLARRLEGGAGLTLSGAPIGTPSYMAPEQGRGEDGTLGPAVDVYALGAILYELLAGRPPFHAETASATLRQVLDDEPVPPARLNSGVPRDLETICLKCLQKTPARRYASAHDLSDDLHRFLDGKPVLARPVSLTERALKWVRRRPAVALLFGALLVMLGAAVGEGVWLQQQEADRQTAKARRQGQAREAVDTALVRTNDVRREERWKEALLVLADASPRLAEASSAELEIRLKQAQLDLRTADVLENARESFPLLLSGDVDYEQRAAEFRTAFELVGLTIDGDVETVAASIRASAVREQFSAALDDRAFVALMHNDGQLVERLLKVARLADPGSTWRDRFRDPAVWSDGDRLQDLVGSAFNSLPPPPEHQLALLGLLLAKTWGRSQRPELWAWSHSAELLGEVCRRQPKYFWAHRVMGFALFRQGRYLESAGYYRGALALRPNNTGALEGLGVALHYAGRREEALAAYRQALKSSPNSTSMRHRLIKALADSGYWNEAKAECHRLLEIDPANHVTPFTFAHVLLEHGRIEEGLMLCREVTEIAPLEEHPSARL